MKSLQSDNGGEYKSDKLARFGAERQIQPKFTPPYTPQLNAVAERTNRTLVECARRTMEYAGLGKSYWGEAVMTAMFLRNRCPTPRQVAISSVDDEETDPGQPQSVCMSRILSRVSSKTLEVRLQYITLSFPGLHRASEVLPFRSRVVSTGLIRATMTAKTPSQRRTT